MEGSHVTQKYIEERRCIQCKTVYKELENIGQLQCRIHPGLRLCDTEGREFFSCCGLYIDAYLDGKVTARSLTGCVMIDHMDVSVFTTGASQLSVTNLDDRLVIIKAFCIKGVPSSILNSRHRVFPPRSSTILFDFNGISGFPLEPLVEHTVETFTQTRHNHDFLKAFHSPYTHSNVRYREKIENTPLGDEETNRIRDTLSINVHQMSERLNQNANRRVSTARRNEQTRDGWPSLYTKKDGSLGVGRNGNEEALVVGKKSKESVPFMIIQRIEDKLDIQLKYSKLGEVLALIRDGSSGEEESY